MKLFSTTPVVMCALFMTAVAVENMPRAYAQNTATASSSVLDPSVPVSGVATGPQDVVIFRFALASQMSGAPVTLSEQACPVHSGNTPSGRDDSSLNEANPAAPLDVSPRIQNEISAELKKKLSKTTTVVSDPEPTAIPTGSLVISGCITEEYAGNGVKRLVGMNWGASRLEAHVNVVRKTEDGFVPVDDFIVKTKGGMILPPVGPIGLATHAIAEPRETLSADSKRLADKLLKKLDKAMKAPEQSTKTS